jgi:hypothetical protein
VTRQQMEALRTFDWLYSSASDARASGRTYVLALAVLRRLCTGAGDHQGWVELEDHIQERNADQNLLRMTWALAGQLGIRLEAHNLRVRLQDRVPEDSRRALFEDLEIREEPVRAGESRSTNPCGEIRRKPKPEVPRPTVWERLLQDDPG